jgi:hypothetical protein
MFKWKFKEVKSPSDDMTLDQVLATMLQLLAEENTNHHRMGQLYNYVVDHNLAEKAGYKDARDYFSKHLCDVSQATLTTYSSVASAFPEELCGQFGVTRLYLLLIYKEAADVEVNHDEPGGTVIEVPGENGAVTPTLFSACSVDEMRKAIQRRRKPASSKPLPQPALSLVDQVRETVMGRFTKGDPVRVQLRNYKGKAVVDFKGIPLEKLTKLAEALLAPPPSALEVRRGDKVPPMA